MFAYCLNNPVNMSDSTGNWPEWATIAVGAVFAVAAVAVTVATLGAAAPAAVCTLTMMGTSLGLSSGLATFVAVGAVTTTVAVTAAYAGDTAYSMVTGDSILLDTVFQGNEEAYNVGLVIASIGSAGIMELAAQSPMCFAAGTPVLAECGLVPIEDIRPGDLVWATDSETGETALREVVQLFRNETIEWIHITVNDEEIVCTPEHPFYSPVKGWTNACDLRAGDILVTVNGEYAFVQSIRRELLENPDTTYNFEVEELHTYYVSTKGVLVHNRCYNDIGSGSYEIEFESGKNYVGKGSEARMKVSARTHSLLNNDPVVSRNWEYAPDTKTAFVDEYFKMAERGVNNPNTYNKIWSPGRKIFMDNWY